MCEGAEGRKKKKRKTRAKQPVQPDCMYRAATKVSSVNWLFVWCDCKVSSRASHLHPKSDAVSSSREGISSLMGGVVCFE